MTDYERQRHADLFGARANWWLTVLGVVCVNVVAWAFPSVLTPICNWSQETVMMISVGAFNVASAIKAALDRRALKAAKDALPLLIALLIAGCASSRPQCVTYKTAEMEVIACDSHVSVSQQ